MSVQPLKWPPPLPAGVRLWLASTAALWLQMPLPQSQDSSGSLVQGGKTMEYITMRGLILSCVCGGGVCVVVRTLYSRLYINHDPWLQFLEIQDKVAFGYGY